jgi:hypothetical protein
MPGDTLAKGGKSATFMGPNVSKEKWERIFGKSNDAPKTSRTTGVARGRRTNPKGDEASKPQSKEVGAKLRG